MTVKPWIVGLALIAAAGTASAQSGLGSRKNGKLFQPRAKSADPGATLFANTQSELTAREALARAMAATGTRNSCGMTPGIARALRPDQAGSATRVVPPPTCR